MVLLVREVYAFGDLWHNDIFFSPCCFIMEVIKDMFLLYVSYQVIGLEALLYILDQNCILSSDNTI